MLFINHNVDNSNRLGFTGEELSYVEWRLCDICYRLMGNERLKGIVSNKEKRRLETELDILYKILDDVYRYSE